MFKHDPQENFKELTIGFFEGRISRRHFIRQATRLGISIAVLNRLAPYAFAAGENLVDSDPSVPHEAPVTKERIEFLKSKPYKGTTIDVLVLKATVGDGLKYYTKLWQEETGGQVNVAEVPIDALHTQIFADLTTGRGRYDSYMTACVVLWRLFYRQRTVHRRDRAVSEKSQESLLGSGGVFPGHEESLYLAG